VRTTAAGGFERQTLDLTGDQPLPALQPGDVLELARSAEPALSNGEGFRNQSAIDALKATLTWHLRKRSSFPVTVALDGQSREFRSSSGSLALVFVLALVFIYLVLAAQFESFVDPLVIMLSVPLSMLGALLALKFTGGTLNVFSQIGLITLVGLITKHGILIVEFANQLREQGMAMRDAVQESAALRLRPILMTTGAMVLGAVPLALATGAGAERRQQIGRVIVGGNSPGPLATNLEFINSARLAYLKCIAECVGSFANGQAPLMAIEFGRRGLETSLSPTADELEALLKGVGGKK